MDCPQCAQSAAEVEQLRQAIETRDLIGQAKGILMERLGLNAEQAFHVLVEVSQRENRKVRDIAVELATTRTIPPAMSERPAATVSK